MWEETTLKKRGDGPSERLLLNRSSLLTTANRAKRTGVRCQCGVLVIYLVVLDVWLVGLVSVFEHKASQT